MGECADCRAKRRPDLQASLSIGPAGDQYEQEAERVATAVAGSGRAGRTLQAPVRPMLRRRLEPAPVSGATAAARVPPSVHATVADAGRPLDAATRAHFEPRFGQDFSRVRVHTDGKAAASAAEIGARAYTVGPHVVFGAGQFAPHRSSGRHLLGHELTHVVQQGESHPVVQRDLVYGSGYPNPFQGDPDSEAAAAAKSPREWFPSSVDFAETATLSQGGAGIATLSGLLTMIGGKAAGSLSSLDLIGHANGDLFALGGTITRTAVTGSKGGTIGPNQLAAAQADIDKVRDRFSTSATITIYGCNSGASGVLLQAIADAFRVCVRGFKDEITWCLGWATSKPAKINSRGRTLINPPAKIDCGDYEGSIYNHKHDMEMCPTPKTGSDDLPKRQPKAPQVPE